ncbi:MAG: hypothetical protein JOZ89_02790, partial [Gammaproteobacteria bacterium]|nr:hypothetical protein [Gammaproteobacteria bacterium]
AYRRIDKPLKIDGAAHIDAAKAFAETRPAKVEACKLLTRAEVEVVIGKLAGDPSGQGDHCNYSVSDPQFPGNVRQYEMSLWWRGGYEHFRSQPYIEGIGMSAVLANTPLAKEAAAHKDDKPAEESGPWLHAGNQGNGFAAVKKDVLVQVSALGQTTPEMRQLAAAVMSKI